MFCFPYYWYFMSHKRCFVYLCYDFPIIGILCFTSVVLYICMMISPSLIFYVSQGCFVYLCSAFPIIGILCITSFVLYIFVMISLLLVFYVSQELFCISVFWFPYNLYFMYHKRCFVYLCSAFPIMGILCFTSVVLYICVLLSLLLVFYVSQALFCISVLWFPYNWYFMFHKRCFVYLCYDFPIIWYFMSHKSCFVYLCSAFSIIVFYVSQALFCISVLW